MKQLICTILLLGCMPLIALTQEHGTTTSDSSNLTNITTTDFMETLEKGKLNWNTVSRFQARCRWGYCNPPRDYGYGSDWGIRICCTFWQMIGNFLFGSGGSNPTDITANGEDGGGAGGSGGGTIWIGTISGGAIPPTPIQPGFGGGGGGGGTNNNNTGNTGTPPPIKPVVLTGGGTVREDSTAMPKDTVQPLKVDCLTFDENRGKLLTKILDSLNKKLETKEIRDSLPKWKFEAGYSIHWDTANQDYIPVDYATGDTNNVEISIYDPAYIIIGGLHTHPKGKAGYAPGPSPKDLYLLANSYFYNPNFRHNFVLSSGADEWAFSIGGDTGIIRSFINQFPDTSFLNGENWSRINKFPGKEESLFELWEMFSVAIRDLFNYPEERCEAYANLLLMKYFLNSGIDLYINDDGKMKKLDIELVYDENNKFENIIIKICK